MKHLDELVAEVRSSTKYRHVSEDLVRILGEQELSKRTYREAVKATRSKLHQVAGAYFDRPPHYSTWLQDMRLARAEGLDALRAASRRVMSLHASTRERLPILDRFYTEIFNHLPPIHSVLDLACGLNPLAIPWMPLSPQSTYIALDIYEDLMTFLEQTIILCDMIPRVISHSVLPELPHLPRVDLAIMLKALPCLEQMDKAAGIHLLEQVQADYILASFPVRSLGGRSKGMLTNYDEHFRTLTADKTWEIRRFQFATELAYLITTDTTKCIKNPL